MSEHRSHSADVDERAPVTGVLSFLLAIDWSEPWLWVVIAFHILNCLLTAAFVIFQKQNLQICLFLVYLGIVYCAEYLNEWASANYRRFAYQQYFDDKGMFISFILSTPLLLNCFVLVIYWVWTSMQTMIKLKKRKLLSERKAQQEKNK